MLIETPKSADRDQPSETSVVYAARLDPKAGKALRIAMAKGLKEKYADNLSRFAKATDLSAHCISNILEGRSDGSLPTMTKVCTTLNIPFADIVGETLAKIAREKYAKPKLAKPAVLPVPPPPSSPVIPRTESVTGLRVGATVRRVPITPQDIAALRRGHYEVGVLGRLLDEYEEMRTAFEKLKNKALREYLAKLDE